jgi:hypothetical protein
VIGLVPGGRAVDRGPIDFFLQRSEIVSSFREEFILL